MALIKGKSKSGFIYEIDERRYRDWRLVKRLKDVQAVEEDADKMSATFEIAELLLGEEMLDKLVQFIADQNEGYAPIEIVEADIVSIIKKEELLKN